MAEDKLSQAITDAESVLKDAFGDGFPLTGEGAGRYLNLDELSKQYSDEATQSIISSEFSQLAKSIRNMRSSFLPISYFLKDNNLQAELADDITTEESYENAFMRMLGMPSVGTSEFAIDENDALIRSSEKLKVLNPKTGEITFESFEFVKENILNQRQMDRSFRNIIIDNNIYAPILSGDTVSFESGVESEDTNSEEPEEDNSLQPSVAGLEDDFWKFSYLLIPPIQDIEISKCISEPEKIVAPNFSNFKNREINSKKMRSSLLESIIRIRLDRLSGTDTFVTRTSGSVATVDSGNDEAYDADSNNYGILEALFILRLRSAISGLARKSIRDIDAILASIEKHGIMPISPDSDSRGQQSERPNDSGSVKATIETDEDSLTKDKENKLKTQKLIEDSILILLGDNSEVLDLQAQTQRSSSMHDAHLMSGLIGIIDIPRKRIVKDLAEITEKREIGGNSSIDGPRERTSSTLGVDIGVGTVDIAVFCLALFTIKENFLLGLLTNAQYDKIKNGEFSSLIANGAIEKAPLIDSINELTDLIYSGYKTFTSQLQDQSIN